MFRVKLHHEGSDDQTLGGGRWGFGAGPVGGAWATPRSYFDLAQHERPRTG